jgi:hypothetical protein
MRLWSFPKKNTDNTLYQAQFSFLICGIDNSRWTGYCFVRDPFENEFPYLEESHASNNKGTYDPIMQDANKAIRDPRAYYLRVLEKRTAEALKHWKYLVRTFQRSANEYVCYHFPPCNKLLAVVANYCCRHVDIPQKSGPVNGLIGFYTP